jgi:glycosyltransferase involved in cell wall biosynthesis
MENCIRSLLIGKDEVEILIINDGSTDRTAEIADRLEKENPGIVRAIHQENKGHGGAVNTGLENASGLYFKVVDSDDKVRASAYRSILDVLRRFSAAEGEDVSAPEDAEEREEPIDLLISNFVYNKEDQNRHKVMEYRKCLPQNRVFDWTEASRFPVGKYILMHSVIFRTRMLRESGLKLPEHTFYVDNIYVFDPLPYVFRMYYLDVDFYYYFIGRDDQSVHESVMIRRLDQQARVNRNMIDYYTDPSNRERIEREPVLDQYMFNYLEIITTITSVLAIRSGAPEHLQIRDEIWEYIKEKDEKLWEKMRRRPLGRAMNSRSKAAMRVVSGGYLAAQRLFNFN